ncbi:bacterial sugar transferase family protein, partial [Vibrio parahaemolyticus V-223/04]
SYRSYSMY